MWPRRRHRPASTGRRPARRLSPHCRRAVLINGHTGHVPTAPGFFGCQTMHNFFVYLAQRRSQEFCCEPNFGGACPRPPSWLRQCVCPINRPLHAAATRFFCGPGGHEVPISRSRRPPGAAAARRSARRSAANASSVTLSASLGSCTHTFINFLCDFYRAMLCIRGTSHGPVSVRPSVCPSQVGVLLKRLNVGSHKQHHMIVQLSLIHI